MITREVTKLLEQHLHPLLREWGFNDFTGRTATMVDGPITVAVQVKSVTKRFSETTGIALGSIYADIGLDHGHANGAGFLRPETVGLDQMNLRAHLRTQGRQFLDEWTDADRAYAKLLIAGEMYVDGAIEVPRLDHPWADERLAQLDAGQSR